MSKHALKPCPFCGSEPMLGEVRPATRKSPPLFGITCIHCGAEMTDEFVPELIQRWNARADLIEPEPERTCVRTLVKSGSVYDVWHFDCCDREYAENKTDAGATELPLDVCPFCGTSVLGEGEMLSMGKDGATVVDMVAEWLEDNDFDGMTDGRCSCSGSNLMHCGLVRSRRCSAAHLFPCTRCTNLTTCDHTTGADVYSTDADWCGEFEEA